ncbi:hypothetical protein CDD80_5797 [Ophiocordyceps camponoti-rufipedis]|uniref:Uncharacterized protein n=1 Tax=Ophiocordyceps camponoti-rufipedis TaxID=2004952 RepID=A0A2C5YUI5_9HYPO|nr:hypothetical protein CDD80_5797 [Ophiocordyceps camponoti-rufipedis]
MCVSRKDGQRNDASPTASESSEQLSASHPIPPCHAAAPAAAAAAAARHAPALTAKPIGHGRPKHTESIMTGRGCSATLASRRQLGSLLRQASRATGWGGEGGVYRVG